MNLLVVGLSHRTAPVSLLERAAVTAEHAPELLGALTASAEVTEALVLSTCNRVEVFAVVESFHGGMADVVDVLTGHAGRELADHLYVRYAGAAVEHVFTVAAGLDSMVVGESQILGQLRVAYAVAAEHGAAGRTLHELAQQALRVGKRVHTDTAIDAAGASVVSEALADAGDLTGCRAVLVGAGSMGALAAAHLRRAGVGELVVVNRSEESARRLAETSVADGVPARAATLDDLAEVLTAADVLVSCTGSARPVVDVATVRLARRGGARPLVVCDLGLPRDVEPGVAELPGVRVVDLATLQRRLADGRQPGGTAEVALAEDIVAEEVAGFLAAQRSAAVTPTITALRRLAADVVTTELDRLTTRLPDVDDAVRLELERTVHRVVDKLLHTPTVRVKKFAAEPGGPAYADALRALFDLDPAMPTAVSAARPPEETGGEAR
ncbi:MAG TPA: glutamyl-tRNA reductase [Pseudonocardiaceae bacterium]